MSLHLFENKENNTFGLWGNSIHKQYFKSACSKEEMIEYMKEKEIPLYDNWDRIPVQLAKFTYDELKATDPDTVIDKCRELGISDKKIREVI